MSSGKGFHAGHCDPAAKPIAWNMVTERALNPEMRGFPISGI
ncbi:MAG: hypothetical protein AAGG06_17345 [Pseudomonadota bacterium]